MVGGRTDVAIIGMACVFPKAPDLRSFWENILAGVDAIGDPPAGSGTDRVFDPSSSDNDRLYTRRGGYLGGVLRFDPLRYGVMPRSVDGSEPEQFVALRLAHDALQDSGYLERPFNRRTAGLILGRGTYVNRGLVSCFHHTVVVDEVLSVLKRLHPEHAPDYLEELRRGLKESLPPFNPETAPGLAHSVMCGRIANRLDLMGPAFTVDAACASSLLAVDAGVKSLLMGECDLVLAGGIQISTTFPISLLFSQLGALARSGQIRPFHPEADGTLLGEGAGIVVLKRRADAEKDGDRVYAVIKGIGTSSDGKAMGLLAPRVEGEELAMLRAYESSGVDPQSIGLIEAHGTGTPVGDATEIEALRRVFGGADSEPRLPIGSVKSMIGHSIPAAAVAGLIKTALALYHKLLPPTLHADTPHPQMAAHGFYLNGRTRPWIHGGAWPRRAGVSAFGFGGINAHAVLEEAVAPRSVVSRAERGDVRGGRLVHARRDSELFVVQAATRAELVARCGALRRFIQENPGTAAHDLAFTLNCPETDTTGADRPAAPGARLAVVAESIDVLDRKLSYALERLADPACVRIKEMSGIYYFEERLLPGPGPVFLFPGEGSQYSGMLSDLCLHFPEVREWFDLMDRAFRDHHRGFVPSQVLFPPPTVQRVEAARRLWEMDSAIESVFAANQALYAILIRLGVKPSAVVGHSTGEYSALLVSGAALAEDEEHLIHYILDGNRATERARASGKVPAGILLAVGPADPEILRVLKEDGSLHLAMDNCPHQVVVCGTEETIARAQADLRKRGAVCQRLPFSRAYHTPLFAPVCEELRGYYERGRFAAPVIPLYSCATAAPVPADPEAVRRQALEQWARPVRFRETIEAMYEAGYRLFVEVGPRGNLTAFVEDTLRGRPHLAIASNLQRRPGLVQLHHLLALLAAHGAPLTLEPLYTDRGARRLPLEALRDGARLAAGPDRSIPLSLELPRLRVEERLVAAARPPAAMLPAPQPPGPAAGRPPAPRAAATGAMNEYLRTMETFLRTQQEVMQAALSRRAPDRSSRPPFLDTPADRRPDGTLVFRKDLSPDDEPFVLDHTLGGRISDDPTLRALPIFPLTMSLELMAEAATIAVPGRLPVGLRSVRAHRWLAFSAPRLTVEITAAARPGGREVEVRISEAREDGPALVTVEGTVILGDRFPAVAPAQALAIGEARPFRWKPGELYAEGQLHGMFHGPAFRGVVSIDRAGEHGAVGTLRVLPRHGLLRSLPDPAFVLDPLLLDAASQIVGYWTANALERGFVVFPVGLERLDLYAPPQAPGTRAVCRVRGRSVGGDQIVADIAIETEDGRPLARLHGWEVKRIDLPERLYAYRLAPRDVIMSTLIPAPARDDVLCRLDLPERLLETDGRIWREGLAHTALSRGERETWRTLPGAEPRRTEWLLARLAAKDAVRLFLKERRGLSVCAADVEIGSDAAGRPVASGAWTGRAGGAPLVSMACGGSAAGARASDLTAWAAKDGDQIVATALCEGGT